jgi:hypothetical membrane protein
MTRVTEPLLWCGLVGAPLFVLVVIVDGATRPGYDVARLPISLLSLGERGWIQVANFLVTGVLFVLFAVGLSRTVDRADRAAVVGSLLLAVFGIGLIAAGLFSADPGGGYPPGEQQTASQSGTLHDVASLVVFVSLPLAATAMSRYFVHVGDQRWAAYSAVTAVAVGVGFALMIVAFNASTPLTSVAGLVQRATVIAGWTWIAAVAYRQLRALKSR